MESSTLAANCLHVVLLNFKKEYLKWPNQRKHSLVVFPTVQTVKSVGMRGTEIRVFEN